MKLPANVLATRDRYVSAFPLWTMPAGEAAEMRAREWSFGLAAQVGFDHPDQGYGMKRGSPTRPVCKDCLAQELGGKLLSWDMLSGAGTGAPTLNPNPDSLDLTGTEQVFEYIAPYDVIGGAPTPEPEPTPPGGDVIPYNEQYSIEFGLGCNEVYKESGAAMDPGMIAVHAMRCQWDYCCGHLTWDESFHKHINEFRHEYGLPPLP